MSKHMQKSMRYWKAYFRNFGASNTEAKKLAYREMRHEWKAYKKMAKEQIRECAIV